MYSVWTNHFGSSSESGCQEHIWSGGLKEQCAHFKKCSHLCIFFPICQLNQWTVHSSTNLIITQAFCCEGLFCSVMVVDQTSIFQARCEHPEAFWSGVNNTSVDNEPVMTAHWWSEVEEVLRSLLSVKVAIPQSTSSQDPSFIVFITGSKNKYLL